MFQFFVAPEQIGEKEAFVTGSDVNHIRNVLRMKPGEQMRISDQQGRDVLCEISQADGEKITLKILKSCEGTEPPVKITLFQALPKGDKMELWSWGSVKSFRWPCVTVW